MNLRQPALVSWSLFGPSHLSRREFWVTALAFLTIYLALNTLTAWYQLNRLGITLWSPDNGLSLLLLIESMAFAPVVLLGEVLVDVFINHVRHNMYLIVSADLLLAVGYAALALVMRDLLKFDPKRVRLADVTMLLIVVPAGATVTSLGYCGFLFLAGTIPADEFAIALHRFWVGDTVGMIVVIPAAASVRGFHAMAGGPWSGRDLVSALGFTGGLLLALGALVWVGADKNYALFYLLFLPIIWVAMRAGFAGVAIALLATQVALFLTSSYVGFTAEDLDVFQMLMLVLSITGLLLGAVVTEREQSARLLGEQRTQLERLSARSLAGGMGMALAHEISQPLSTVATYLHAARRMVRSGADPELVMEALAKAEKEARRTREVLERVRDFVSSGRMELEPVDLQDVLVKISALCHDDASAKGVQLGVESAYASAPLIASRIGIEQVLNNLVANAIDAASERADRSGSVVMRLESAGDRVAIMIEDNGRGVAPEIADTLFEAYRSTKPRGMGLGLAISRQIVQRHAGRIWWEPIAPTGTRFVIELPFGGVASRQVAPR